MSDHGIVGMGLVHVQSPIFVEKPDKISHCDLECSFKACGKHFKNWKITSLLLLDIFNCELIRRLNCSNSLLPSLSIFKEVLYLKLFVLFYLPILNRI